MAEQYNADEIATHKTRVTYVAMWVNVFLTLIKIGVGIVGQSAALIADGIHSLSDLASDLLVIIAIKLGAREAYYEHPYGHKRFETLATVILGIGLIVIAGGIGWDVSERLLHPETLLTPSYEALGIAFISILANEWLYHYTKRVGKQTRSKLLMANAWHHRSDAISSVIVLFGIAAVMLGYPFADAVAAIIVALMVGKIGLKLVFESIKELVDTSLSEDLVQEIRREIKITHGVVSIHLLRTRQMGEDAYIDAHIVVDSRISVSEGHMIGDKVRENLIQKFDDVVDVLVHIDPEDDEFKDKSKTILTRSNLLELLEQALGEELYERVEAVNIHYLNDSVEMEVIIPKLLLPESKQVDYVNEQCHLLVKEHESIEKIYLFLKV
ncbi:MAG: cation diffusion facilitator family transporter [Methylococcaceae bacterium]|nr:cation diffusion facilitator family transporter [Methylococcaceae bacterium]